MNAQLSMFDNPEPRIFDKPPNPTKKYIASLLRSEDLAVNADLVQICQEGWIDASSDTDEVRRRRVDILQKLADGPRLDVYAIGYVTFVRAYTGAMR